MGIFSQASGNNITGPTDVCAVTLRYTGTDPQTLSLEGLKLVYEDAAGKITGVNGFPVVSFTIDPDYLAEAATTIDGGEVPLAGLFAGNTKGITPGAMCVIAAAVLLVRRNKQIRQLTAQGAVAADPGQVTIPLIDRKPLPKTPSNQIQAEGLTDTD